ncbi:MULTISPECIES: marine proteobacterial sortase target protein [unclassified Shewanella]|uniref:marine proteobacterial sortase target protein n=1 Tax=unclassified Shewanella TaxID=196818 RepID=UPI0035516123
MKRLTRYRNRKIPVIRNATNKLDLAAYGCSGLILLALMLLNVLFPVHAMGSSDRRNTGSEHKGNDLSEVTQGILRYQVNGQQFESLPLKTDVRMKVSGWTNRVSVKQTFTNQSSDWINGSYIFPLSSNSAVDQMRLIIGERVIEGDIQPKKQAKATFEKAKSQGKRASLVSQQRANIFTTEVANLGPKETLTVEISYQEKLRYRDGEFSLRFPMTINPRYKPGSSAVDGETVNRKKVNGVTVTSELSQQSYESLSPTLPSSLLSFSPEFLLYPEADDRSEIDYELDDKNSDGVTVNLQVELEAGFNVADINSPYQEIKKVGAGDKWQISLVGQQKANKDFVLTWRAQANESLSPLTAVFTQQGQTHEVVNQQSKEHSNKKSNEHIDNKAKLNQVEYGLVMLTPPAASNQSQFVQRDPNTNDDISKHHVPRELILVIDTSGSMSGGSLEQAKQAMLYALAGLTSQDKFNVIEFNHATSQLSEQSLVGSSSNIGKANQFVRQLEANGGTEISKALSVSLTHAANQAGNHEDEFNRAQEHSTLLRQVIFITDGAVSNEHGLFQQIEAELGDSRLFTVGIGSAPNSYFMERAAMFGRGTYTYIGKTSEVKSKISQLLAKIEKPVSTDIKLTYQDGTVPDYWPAQIPDLYQDEPLLVSYKSPSYNQQDLIVSGYSQGQFWQHQINRNAPKQAAGLDLIWANAQIDAIEATQSRSNLQRVKKQVEALGMKYHLVTSQTSLVAVDKTPVNPMAEFNRNQQVKRHMPDGWKRPQGVLPQTATSSRLNILIGLSLLIIALLHGLWLKGLLPAQRLILPKNNEQGGSYYVI